MEDTSCSSAKLDGAKNESRSEQIKFRQVVVDFRRMFLQLL